MTNRHKTTLYLAAIAAAALALTSTASFSQPNAPHLVGSWKGAVSATSPPGLAVHESDHVHERRYGDRIPAAPGRANSLWDIIRDDQSRRLATD